MPLLWLHDCCFVGPEKIKARNGGAATARLLCVVTTRRDESGRYFRPPNERDLDAASKAAAHLSTLTKAHRDSLSLIPDEAVNPLPHSINRLPIYGMATWGDAFMPRQTLTLVMFTELVRRCRAKLVAYHDDGLVSAVQSVLALGVSRLADICNALCPWSSGMQQVQNLRSHSHPL